MTVKRPANPQSAPIDARLKPAYEAALALPTATERAKAMAPIEFELLGTCYVVGRARLQRMLDDAGFEAIDALQLARRVAAKGRTRFPRRGSKSGGKGRAA